MESRNFIKAPFQILHMDGLGQGVSKILDKTTFIPKTLPGEEGDCLIHQKRKNVFFAYLQDLEDLKKSSPDRIQPECVHFQQCPGCHYLHTSYDQELLFKQNALARELRKLKTDTPPIQVFKGPQRFHYRNRIVLHYDLDKEVLGIFSTLQQAILPIPRCMLPLKSIRTEMENLYQNNYWMVLLKNAKAPTKGHLEIYQGPEAQQGPSIAINDPYAHLGFSQVNEAMNEEMKKWVQQKIQDKFPTDSFLIDLFGGSGNLTGNINNAREIVVVDKYKAGNFPRSTLKAQSFHSVDLFNPGELKSFFSKTVNGSKLDKIDALILDPPRSGFLQLKDCAERWNPQMILYVSCSPDTQARDLVPLMQNYSVKSVSLFDMFPGTFHFETAICLERK